MIRHLMTHLTHSGPVRTNLWCHECRNDFSVDLDYSLDGNHVVDCPHCAHKHYRVIKDGRVTSERWASSQPSYPYTITGGSNTLTFGRIYASPVTISTGTALTRVVL